MVRASPKPRTGRATKKDLHRIVDELPTSELVAAQRYLSYLQNMGDPILRSIEDAPMDDEPISQQELADIRQEAKAARRGKTGTPIEVVAKRLGVKLQR